MIEAVAEETQSRQCSQSGSRLVMLFVLMPSVDILCRRAEVVGGRMPTSPKPINPQLKPIMNR